MLSYQFVYLLLNLLLFSVWLFLFMRRKDLRHKIVLLSLIIGCLGPISEYWYLQDYWKPLTLLGYPIGIEDYLFGFFIGGIGSVVYEELFGKRFVKRRMRSHHWALFFVILSGISVLIEQSLFYFVKLNSIYASVIAFIILAITMIFFRKDLFIDAIVSGIACGVLLVACYFVLLLIYPEMFLRM